MEDALKRLLDAEGRASAIIEEANEERERLIAKALDDARVAEARFDSGCTDLRAPFIKEAQARADQAVTELTRKYEERQKGLRDLATRHEEEAVSAALGLLLDPRY